MQIKIMQIVVRYNIILTADKCHHCKSVPL